jgi:hypothetical protein
VFGFSFAAFPFFATIVHLSQPTARPPGWLAAFVYLLVFGWVGVCLMLVWGTLFAVVARELLLLLHAFA